MLFLIFLFFFFFFSLNGKHQLKILITYPSNASLEAQASPIPLAPPVMSIVLPGIEVVMEGRGVVRSIWAERRTSVG